MSVRTASKVCVGLSPGFPEIAQRIDLRKKLLRTVGIGGRGKFGASLTACAVCVCAGQLLSGPHAPLRHVYS